ncbi:hypothetical protein [Peijinzhouia sedimentorum]
MIYLTYGNQSHGVYSSYVIENCKYISDNLNYPVKIIALVSIRGFFEMRRIRKQLYPNSIILPMVPGFHRWKLNLLTLTLLWPFIGKKKVMALSPLAANLAISLKDLGLVDKVIYDGEGATAAEWNEFDVVGNEDLKKDIWKIESRAVNDSDMQRAVSHKMFTYWNEKFAYTGQHRVVIPCLLNGVFADKPSIGKIDFEEIFNEPKTDQITFVYAGSSAQWQSMDLLEQAVIPLMEKDGRIRLLLLSDQKESECGIKLKFPSRVVLKWVPFEQVPAIMALGDYGILLRHPSVTNFVAAPTKFAEYLACGLKVFISPGIGDYPDMIAQNPLGYVIEQANDLQNIDLEQTSLAEKQKLREFALNNFVRTSFKDSFAKLISL